MKNLSSGDAVLIGALEEAMDAASDARRDLYEGDDASSAINRLFTIAAGARYQQALNQKVKSNG